MFSERRGWTMTPTRTSQTGQVARRVVMIGALALIAATGCGGDDDDAADGASDDAADGATAGGDDATAIALELSERAQAEFVERGDGLFFDTGFLSYCRAGSGFADGILAELGYTDENAPAGYELCYNVNADLTVVALGVTSMRSGDTTCVRLDASSGELVAGEPETVDSCGP